MGIRFWTGVILVTVGLATAAAGQLVAAHDEQGLRLEALTMPQSSLPGGCGLEPVVTEEVRISPDGRVTPAGRLALDGRTSGFATNPWQGTDRPQLLGLRQRMYPTPRVPDGIPLNRAEAARFEERLLADIVEGYRGAYRSGAETVEVLALRFTNAERAADNEPPIGSFPTAHVTRRVMGPIVVLARSTAKETSACARAVHEHIRTLKP